MRGIDGHPHGIEGNDDRFQSHPIDRGPLRLKFFDIAAKTIQIDRELTADEKLGQKRMATAYNEILLRQLFRKRKSPLPTHHLQQAAVHDVVGVIHRHFALPYPPAPAYGYCKLKLVCPCKMLSNHPPDLSIPW